MAPPLFMPLDILEVIGARIQRRIDLPASHSFLPATIHEPRLGSNSRLGTELIVLMSVELAQADRGDCRADGGVFTATRGFIAVVSRINVTAVKLGRRLWQPVSHRPVANQHWPDQWSHRK